jgi:hypothetical protein
VGIFLNRLGDFGARVQSHSGGALSSELQRLGRAAELKKRAGLCARRRYVANRVGSSSMRDRHHGLQRVRPDEKGLAVLADRAGRRALKGRRGRIIRTSNSRPRCSRQRYGDGDKYYSDGDKDLLSAWDRSTAGALLRR